MSYPQLTATCIPRWCSIKLYKESWSGCTKSVGQKGGTLYCFTVGLQCALQCTVCPLHFELGRFDCTSGFRYLNCFCLCVSSSAIIMMVIITLSWICTWHVSYAFVGKVHMRVFHLETIHFGEISTLKVVGGSVLLVIQLLYNPRTTRQKLHFQHVKPSKIPFLSETLSYTDIHVHLICNVCHLDYSGCAEYINRLFKNSLKLAIQSWYTVNTVPQTKLARQVIERTPPTTLMVAFNVEAKITLLQCFGHISLNYSPIFFKSKSWLAA